MSQGLVERQNLEDIADAIRSKNGSTDTYTPAEMAQAISEIQTADEFVLVQKTVNANGQYNASDDSADGYSGVRVNVPNTYGASDEGKVVSNGNLVAQTSKNINANGTHDTTANNSVVVDVPNSYVAADEGKVVSGGALVGQTSKNITYNGTYDTTENNEVVVNISGGGGGSGNVISGTKNPSSNIGSDGDIYLKYLPAYIKNTNTQYINTGYSGNSDSKYVIDFMLGSAQTSQYPTVFGARSEVGAVVNASYFDSGVNYNHDVSSIGWGTAQPQAFSFGDNSMMNKITHIELESGICKVVVDDSENTFTFTPTAFTGTTPIGIFAMLIQGSIPGFTTIMNNMYLFEFKIYEDDVLIHDFVPIIDSNDTPCLHDIITDEYKYNAGSGTFEYSSGGDIIAAYCKVNGAWQNLIGANIDDLIQGD
jgi:hypothetical protein